MRQDLFREAYRIIQAIPDHQVNMNEWMKKGCNTIGCAAGHLSAQGVFRIEGFSLSQAPAGYYRPTIYRRSLATLGLKKKYTGYDAVAKLFDISPKDAGNLFGPVEMRTDTDKNMFLSRLRAYAQKHKFSLEESVATYTGTPKQMTAQLLAKVASTETPVPGSPGCESVVR